MRQRRYEIVLSGKSYTIFAFNEREAIILAQAEAIRSARNYEYESIKDITDEHETRFRNAIRASLTDGSFGRALTGQQPKVGDICTVDIRR